MGNRYLWSGTALQFLQEKGWGDSDTPMDAEKILTREREKTWEDIRELVSDMSVFGILDYPNVFHNLKAAIKEVCTEGHSSSIFYKDTEPSAETILEAVRSRDFASLPEYMADAAAEAFETLLHTRDGQLCDVIVDRATLDAIYQAGKAAKDEVIRNYAESTVAVADIKIAVRSQKTAKSLEFMRRALAPCDTLDVEALAHAALGARKPFGTTWQARTMRRVRRLWQYRPRPLSAGATTALLSPSARRSITRFPWVPLWLMPWPGKMRSKR